MGILNATLEVINSMRSATALFVRKVLRVDFDTHAQNAEVLKFAFDAVCDLARELVLLRRC